MKNMTISLAFVTVMLANLSTASAEGNREDPGNWEREFYGRTDDAGVVYSNNPYEDTRNIADVYGGGWAQRQAEVEWQRQVLAQQFEGLRQQLGGIRWQINDLQNTVARLDGGDEYMRYELEQRIEKLLTEGMFIVDQMNAVKSQYYTLD